MRASPRTRSLNPAPSPQRPPARRPATTDAADPGHAADADDDAERGPLRRCALTRERLAKEAMIRFVIAPDRGVVPDLAGRLPGRGIWLSARRDVIQAAGRKGAFARAARGAVTVPSDLLERVVAALERRIGDQLGFARRAGQAVAGYDKAHEWLVSGRAGLVVQAADGSPDERARFVGKHAGTVPAIALLSGARLGQIFGRERVVHVAVAEGRLEHGLRTEAGRLLGLTPQAGADGARDETAGARAKRGSPGHAPGGIQGQDQAVR